VVVKDRVHLVVQDRDTDAVQQFATLADEVGCLRRDVTGLADALGKGLDEFGDQQTAAAAARDAESARRTEGLVETVRRLALALDRMHGEQELLVQALGELRAAHAAEAAAPPIESVPAASSGVAESAPARPEASPEPDPAAPAAGAAAGAPEAAVPGRRRSAFAFALPSQAFRFAGRQRFELLPNLSRVGFDAKSTLHDFTGVTSKLAGTIEFDLAAPQAGAAGEIAVDARALDTGLAGRNDALRQHLATEQHPDIRFAVRGFTDAVVDAEAHTVSADVVGDMTIRGRTRAVKMPVRLHVDDSSRVHARGEMPLRLSDYGVPVPSQLGMIRMQDAVKVWIALQARSVGPAAGEARGR
jgi:polyisoprenoid-binding protein YceI